MNKLLLVTGILASGSLMAASMPAKHFNPTATGPQGWYVGIGMIAPESLKAEMYSNDYATPISIKQDNYPIGGEIFAGYRVNSNFGTEFTVGYLGDLKWKDKVSTGDMKVKNNYRLSYDGLLYMPIANGFEVFGKAGIGYLYQKVEGTGTLAGQDGSKVSTFALNYGVGVGYNYQQFGISLDYTKFKPSETIEDYGDIEDILGLDVQYYFG